MIKEPEDEAFEEIEKAQQRRELLVDKGCAERGCMGYDDRDGDKPVKMRVVDELGEQRKPWVGLTDEEIEEWTPEIHSVIRAIETKLKEKNT